MEIKVWRVLTKAIHRQVIVNQKCIEVPGLGKFKAVNNTVAFCVALDLLASGKYKFQEND